MPDEPATADPTPPPSVSGIGKAEEMERSLLTSEEEASSEEEEGSNSDEERERQIKELQDTVRFFNLKSNSLLFFYKTCT